MSQRIFLTASALLTPTGATPAQCFAALIEGAGGLAYDESLQATVGRLHADAEKKVGSVVAELEHGKRLDRTTLLAAACARELSPGSFAEPNEVGVIIGSSRGATISFESYHEQFISKQKSSPSMSPATTAVTTPSTVARMLHCQGPALAVSSACQTGLTALGTAYSFILANQGNCFIAGGVEASLTAFTLGSLEALGLLSRSREAYPLQCGEPQRDGTVFSEGAGLFLVETEESMHSAGRAPLAEIVDFAQAGEQSTLTGISVDAQSLQRCIEKIKRRHDAPDLIVGHFPGTVQGDDAEAEAYARQLPGTRRAALKWSTGHMLAASPCFSVTMAVEMMRHSIVPAIPFATGRNSINPSRKHHSVPLRAVLITALGFGGNASALLLRKP